MLFATDLSKASDVALECVAGWKTLGLSKVTVAHVHNIQYAGGAAGLEEPLRADHDRSWNARRSASATPVSLVRGGWDSVCHTWRWIASAARRAPRPWCLARTGARGSRRCGWAPIADAILRHATLPVLVLKVNRLVDLPPERCVDACDSLFGKVLLATDFSPATAGAVDAVRTLARRFSSEVRLVHIQEHSRIFPHLASRLDDFNREDGKRLDDLAAELRRLGAREVSQDVRTDHATKGLMDTIDTWQPRLVVVGRHGRGALAGRLIGSISHQVAREAAVPVLVVPHSRG